MACLALMWESIEMFGSGSGDIFEYLGFKGGSSVVL